MACAGICQFIGTSDDYHDLGLHAENGRFRVSNMILAWMQPSYERHPHLGERVQRAEKLLGLPKHDWNIIVALLLSQSSPQRNPGIWQYTLHFDTIHSIKHLETWFENRVWEWD